MEVYCLLPETGKLAFDKVDILGIMPNKAAISSEYIKKFVERGWLRF